MRIYYTFFMCLCLVLNPCEAASTFISHQWVVSYSQRSLLGAEKQIIVINGMFPGPLLNGTTNDVFNINVHNNLTEPFLITWNGVQMRRNSWQDGVRGTNCPIPPGKNWTYNFQIKDQIGSYFYFPFLLLQKAAGGFGPIRLNNLDSVPPPFPRPDGEFDVLIGDWFNSDHRDLRASLDTGISLPMPDGILINGLGPKEAVFDFEPGKTYRLRISNVGLKTSLNFRIQGHDMLLVETEGSYVQKQHYDSLDVHVGQSYSVLVTAKEKISNTSYYMIATSRFTEFNMSGLGLVRYPNSTHNPVGPVPPAPGPYDYAFSVQQAQSIRLDLNVGAARQNAQGSFHYADINVSRTLVLRNDVVLNWEKLRYTVNGISFVHPETPLKLADHFQLNDTFTPDLFRDFPPETPPSLGTAVVDVLYESFLHIVLENPLEDLQSWHMDGHNFFVVGMGFGAWSWSNGVTYNLVDAISRSTVQVYPYSWTAILVAMDNQGMWNVRSQTVENWFLGQELYFRVKGEGQENPKNIPVRDESPIPENFLRCGKVPPP
ncbi:PREDICTED: monocopper oxidase-like protein SKS1 [Tarenaya hassleriana]|uniref:monocopper oxidase-like protein SKS1 n=1 Tax=Tarenaya hassleriana TaxID=28532 RepID=UPI00053C1007|nr:PREDICTED: monocopper oxidase-like protein SKS1 [Tarenaya hassleriana]